MRTEAGFNRTNGCCTSRSALDRAFWQHGLDRWFLDDDFDARRDLDAHVLVVDVRDLPERPAGSHDLVSLLQAGDQLTVLLRALHLRPHEQEIEQHEHRDQRQHADPVHASGAAARRLRVRYTKHESISCDCVSSPRRAAGAMWQSDLMMSVAGVETFNFSTL